MQTKNFKLLSPWESLVNQFKVLFANDPKVKVEFREEDMEIRLYVEGQRS